MSDKQQKRRNLPKHAPSHRDAALMGIMRWAVHGRLKETYGDVSTTYGYITKNTCVQPGHEKPHASDTYCIAENLRAKLLETMHAQRKLRRNNRQTFRADTSGGVRQRNQAPYAANEFRLFDEVRFRGSMCYVTGWRASGYFPSRHWTQTGYVTAQRLRTGEGGRGNFSPSYRKRSLPAKR